MLHFLWMTIHTEQKTHWETIVVVIFLKILCFTYIYCLHAYLWFRLYCHFVSIHINWNANAFNEKRQIERNDWVFCRGSRFISLLCSILLLLIFWNSTFAVHIFKAKKQNKARTKSKCLGNFSGAKIYDEFNVSPDCKISEQQQNEKKGDVERVKSDPCSINKIDMHFVI